MDSFLAEEQEKKGINKGYLIGIVVGVLLIAAAIFAMSFRPPVDDQMAKILEGAYREGTPEFAELTKDIIISTDDRTVQSPNGFGAISMFIVGKVRNKGTRTMTIVEVNVAVVDSFNTVLKEKRVLLVPIQHEKMNPGEIVSLTTQLDGFDKKDDRANIRWRVTGIKAE